MINLNDFRRKETSQGAEDGITLKLFEIIKPHTGIAVEIGVGSGGDECCSRVLKNNMGFKLFLFDMDGNDAEVKKVKITPHNIMGILEEACIPEDIDFLGLDIDSYDFYVMHKILAKYRPRVIVVETNPVWTDEDKVIDYDHFVAKWPSGFDAYHGAGLGAWFASLNPLGYRLVCHEYNGINAFFVRDGLINPNDIIHYNSLELFNIHEHTEERPKPGCRISNYSMYPDDYPVRSSAKALEITKALE